MARKASSSDWEYCLKILPGVSRTFALNIRELEGETFKSVLLGYLLFRIADTFEDNIFQGEEEKAGELKEFSNIFKGDKPLEERLKLYGNLRSRWKEESCERELVENGPLVLRCYFDILPEHREIIDPLISECSEGMADFQMRKLINKSGIFQMKDLKELEEYCYYVAGIVGVMLTGIFCQKGGLRKRRAELERFQVPFGLALQLTNIVKDYRRDIDRGWCYIPITVTERYRIDTFKIESFSPGKTRRLLGDMINFITPYLDSALKYIKILPVEERSVRMFCIIPFVLAYRTLAKIVMAEGDKVSREEVARIMKESREFSGSNTKLEKDYTEIKKAVRRIARRNKGITT